MVFIKFEWGEKGVIGEFEIDDMEVTVSYDEPVEEEDSTYNMYERYYNRIVEGMGLPEGLLYGSERSDSIYERDSDKEVKNIIDSIKEFMIEYIGFDYLYNIIFEISSFLFSSFEGYSSEDDSILICSGLGYEIRNNTCFMDYCYNKFREVNIECSVENVIKFVIFHEIGHIYDEVYNSDYDLRLEKQNKLKNTYLDDGDNYYNFYMELPMEKVATEYALDWLFLYENDKESRY